VRPNQGLIGPGGSETIQIILVEKDKSSLLQSFQRLGQSALDHSKDKFLVQSCTVKSSFTSTFQTDQTGYDSLSILWTGVTAPGSSTAVANKKLHVRHVVGEAGTGSNTDRGAAGGGSGPAAATARHETSLKAMEGMSQEQLLQEVTALRRKYDELVAFSVNLTAERDILNNTLEQTKRDLNREVSRTAASDNKGSAAAGMARPAQGGTSWLLLLVVALVAVVAGTRLEQMGMTGFMRAVPEH
jgi:vesicle-associated membrane protein-associated protein A